MSSRHTCNDYERKRISLRDCVRLSVSLSFHWPICWSVCFKRNVRQSAFPFRLYVSPQQTDRHKLRARKSMYYIYLKTLAGGSCGLAGGSWGLARGPWSLVGVGRTDEWTYAQNTPCCIGHPLLGHCPKRARHGTTTIWCQIFRYILASP